MTNTSTFDALSAMYKKNGGTITPTIVVEESRPETADLHDQFEWDDSVAGEQYRLNQAALMIRKCHIRVQTNGPREAVTVRAFISTQETVAEGAGSGSPAWSYTSITDLNARGAEVVLAQMQRDVAALRRKYRDHEAALNALLREGLDGAA